MKIRDKEWPDISRIVILPPGARRSIAMLRFTIIACYLLMS